jgi:hypothetical protein
MRALRPGLPLLAVLLLAAGPAAAGESLRDRRPDWTSGESTEFPRHLYVLGVGSADDRPTAEERARAEVARVFKTRVVATTSAFASETSRAAGGPAETVSNRATSDETRTSTDKDLVGVEIAATWQDPATRQVYALATLDRRQATARLEAQLEAIEASVRPLGATIRSGDRLGGGLAALRYRALAKQRGPILTDLAVVSPGRQPAASPLDAEAREALAKLAVSLQARGAPDAVRTAVTRGMGKAGLSVRPADDGPSDLAISVETTLEDLGKRDGWAWARCSGTVVVRESGTGRVWVQLTASEKQSATVPAEAPGRAVKALAARLEERIPAELEAGTPASP